MLMGLHPEESPDEVPAFAFEEAHHRGVPLEAVTAFRLPPPQGAPARRAVPGAQVPPPLPLADDAEDLVRGAEREQEERLRPFAARWPDVELRPVVVPGDAAGRLVEGSRDAGLVVVGRHHRHHLGSLLIGSVAHAVLHGAHCPVAVVPGTRRPGRTGRRRAMTPSEHAAAALRNVQPPPAHASLGAGVVVTDGSGRVLLGLHRSGVWELPGGKVEPGESVEAAAVRELAEETALVADPADVEVLGLLLDSVTSDRMTRMTVATAVGAFRGRRP